MEILNDGKAINGFIPILVWINQPNRWAPAVLWNDGHSDRTIKELEQSVKTHKEVRLIHIPENTIFNQIEDTIKMQLLINT